MNVFLPDTFSSAFLFLKSVTQHEKINWLLNQTGTIKSHNQVQNSNRGIRLALILNLFIITIVVAIIYSP